MKTSATDDSLSAYVLERPLHYLWGLAADLGFFVHTILLGTPAIVLTLLLRRGWPIDAAARIWAKLIVWSCGIRVEVEGLERLERGRSYVLVSNHLSNFDIYCTIAAVPLQIRFVAKKELLRWPVFGQALAVSDHIVIDRKDSAQAIAAVNAAVARARDGICILFYAEGTRSPDGSVGSFKKGAVITAINSQLPVVPMSVSGTRKFLPKGCKVIRPGGRVKIVLGDPIETAGLTLEQRDELNEKVRRIVIESYIEDY